VSTRAFQTSGLELTSRGSFVDVRDPICELCEPDIAEKVGPVWGVDDECEMNSVWRDCGVENLWIVLGIVSGFALGSGLGD
jgi:hypothetical protein